MNNLLGRQVDSNYVVRMYCIRGLGNMADIGGSQVCHYLIIMCFVVATHISFALKVNVRSYGY